MVGAMLGVTEITIAGSGERVAYLAVCNLDTSEVTVLVKGYDPKTTGFTLRKRTIQPDDVEVIYAGEDSPRAEEGERLTISLSAAVAATQPNYHLNRG